MTERFTNSRWIPAGKRIPQSKDSTIQKDFNNLQIKFNEEKKKNFNIKMKNYFLENKLKEMDKVWILINV